MLLVQLRGLGLLMYRHFVSSLQLINLGLSSIALSNYIHLNLAYCSQSTPHSLLVTIRISIADLIGGTRGISMGYPYAWAPLDVQKLY